MPELSSAPSDVSVTGTEQVLTLEFKNVTINQISDYVVSQVGNEYVNVAMSDMTTSLTTGTGKAMWIAPEPGTLVDVWCGVFGQSSSGVVRIDLNKNGSTVLSTRPSIDANESTSLTGTAAVISSASFVKGDIFTFDIDDSGTSAEGLQAVLEYTPT